MPITFLDQRDQSTQTISTIIINEFVIELNKIFAKKVNWNRASIENLIKGIKNDNNRNNTRHHIYIDMDFMYISDIVNLAESYDIPILLKLSDLDERVIIRMTELFKNKKCIKHLILSSRNGYQHVTSFFIDSLLSTDIYGLSLYFVTPDINKFFRLIEVNKLVTIRLSTEGQNLNYSLLFNELLKSLFKIYKNILKNLIIDGIEISGEENESNAIYLATLIQENINLEEINLGNCFLTVNFLNLLADKLLETKNISSQPLRLDLRRNENFGLVVAKFSDCLAANVSIRDLDLYNTLIDENGAKLIGQALEHNNVLDKLSLSHCPIGHGVQNICRGILNNIHSGLTSLDFTLIETFDLIDANVLADLIRANHIRELKLYKSFNPQLEITEIYDVLLDALAENNSLLKSDLIFSNTLIQNEEIYNKIINVFYSRTIPIDFIEIKYLEGNDDLYDIMNLQLHNYAVSSKTLIQILQEYKK